MTLEVDIFLLPHQDDELGVITSIIDSIKKPDCSTYCIYLSTNPNNIDRDKESKNFFKFLNLSSIKQIFLGSHLGIYDLKVSNNLNKLYKYLFLFLNNNFPQNIKLNIYTPSYEGGHPDHDSSYVIGLKINKNFNGSNHFTFPLYNYENKRFGFFNAFKPLNKYCSNERSVSFPRKFIWLLIFAPFVFHSQLRSILILYPFYLLRILKGFSLIQELDGANIFVLKQPHKGKLYYEHRLWNSSHKLIKIFNQFLIS